MFFYSYIKKNHHGLVIIIRFRHWLIVHDDETVISYFMPRHQTVKFSYNFKAKRYNVNLMNKNNRNPSILGRFSVIKWRNWSWWESYLNTGISDETQFALVIWLPCKCIQRPENDMSRSIHECIELEKNPKTTMKKPTTDICNRIDETHWRVEIIVNTLMVGAQKSCLYLKYS